MNVKMPEQVIGTYSKSRPEISGYSCHAYHLMADDGLTLCGKSFWYPTKQERLPDNHPAICWQCLNNRKYLYG